MHQHVFENVSERKARFGERCLLTALRESPKCSYFISTRTRIAGNVPHLYNGLHVYGYKLPEQLAWSSDDAALFGALLLQCAVKDLNF